MTVAELVVPLSWAGATHLAMWAAGSWVRARIVNGAKNDDDLAARAFQSAMLGMALFGALAFALGAMRVLYAPLLAGIVAVFAISGLWRIARGARDAARAPAMSDVPLLACGAFVLMHVPRALIPVLEHDENVYHLLIPKLYLAAHAMTPLPWSLGANMPHLVDLGFVFPAAFGGLTAAKVFVLGCIGWTLVGLAPFGRAMLGPIGPGVLGALYLSARAIQWHLGVAYVEPVIGAWLLCALQSLWRLWDDGDRSQAVILAVVAGAAAASKYTVWPLVAALVATAAWVRLPDGRRLGPKATGVMVGLAALFVLPWLVKNALVTGNPIYPNAQSVFGGAHWSKIQDVQFQHEMGYGRGADRNVATYLTLPFRLVTDPYTGILGGAALSASVMALLLTSMVFPWRRGEFRTVLRVLVLLGFLFWCLGSKQTRYLVAWVPVMVVTAGIALVPLARFRAALASVTLTVVVVALVQIRMQPFPAEPILDAFTVSRQELLSRNLCWDLAQFLNGVVPPGGRVLSFWENRLYFLDRPFITDSAYGAPTALAALREAGDARRFALEMAAEGVTHVVVNPYFYKTYMANEFLYSLIDDAFYPAERLAADHELLDRFINTELDAVPWEGDWAVFTLRAAGEGAVQLDEGRRAETPVSP